MKPPKRKTKAAAKPGAKKKRRILPRRKKKTAAKAPAKTPAPHGTSAAKNRKVPHPKPRTVAAAVTLPVLA